MRMNDAAKLNFALEHVAHLEDYINDEWHPELKHKLKSCLLYTSPSPRDRTRSRMPSSA